MHRKLAPETRTLYPWSRVCCSHTHYTHLIEGHESKISTSWEEKILVKKIDVHCHYIPESCVELQQPGPIVAPQVGDITDLGIRLRDMDAMGIDMQAMSPWPGFLNRDLGIARAVNHGMADAVDRYPERFTGLATVPMSRPAEAAKELERAVKNLGLRGVGIGSHVNGTNLDSRDFAPFYVKVQELDVPVFIHPVEVFGTDRLKSYYLSNLLGNPTETALAAASLIFGGVLKEFPRLKFYLSHGGGSCPYLLGRWDHGWKVRTEGKVAIEHAPSEYFKLLYFDALVHSHSVLGHLVQSAGAERVMLGTDYPFDMGNYDPLGALSEVDGLSTKENEQIQGRNAAALFKIDG